MITVLFLITCGAAVRADTRAIQQQLQAEYMKADAATRTKDIKGLMARYLPDFKLKVSDKRILGREKVQDLLSWQFVATKKINQLTFTIQALTVKGDTAYVTVKQTESLVVVLSKVEHVIASSQISVDTWVKTSNGWRLKYQEVKQNVTTEDGKPVQQISSITIDEPGANYVA